MYSKCLFSDILRVCCVCVPRHGYAIYIYVVHQWVVSLIYDMALPEAREVCL